MTQEENYITQDFDLIIVSYQASLQFFLHYPKLVQRCCYDAFDNESFDVFHARLFISQINTF